MSDLKLSFMTLDDGYEIAVSPNTDESKELFFRLLSCFGEIEHGVLKVKAEQRATKELKQNIERFTKFHSTTSPILKKLNNKISNLPENQFFLILNNIPEDTAQKHKLEMYLSLLNEVDGGW